MPSCECSRKNYYQITNTYNHNNNKNNNNNNNNNNNKIMAPSYK